MPRRSGPFQKPPNPFLKETVQVHSKPPFPGFFKVLGSRPETFPLRCWDSKAEEKTVEMQRLKALATARKWWSQSQSLGSLSRPFSAQPNYDPHSDLQNLVFLSFLLFISTASILEFVYAHILGLFIYLFIYLFSLFGFVKCNLGFGRRKS